METHQKPNYMRFNLETDKPFYAAYLNTAKQNVYIVIRDISESLRLGFDLNDDSNMLDAQIWKKLAKNDEPDLSMQIIEKLEDRFPFANFLAMNNAYFKRKERIAQPSDYCDIFKLLINQLYEYRNYYTHAVHQPVEMNQSIIKGMQILFDSSRREVKDRFSLKTSDVDHLVRLSSKKENGENIAYEKESFKYRFVKDEALTEKGFLFFASLWLQRKYAQELLKKHEGFKRSESPSQKATLEAFTYYSIKLPQPRLTSDNSKEGLLLDMVNELKRCPKELYPLLHDNDREKFKTVEEDKAIGSDNEYEAMPILKRSSNRFYYFALRYLENAFQTIKFHIDLGNYCFHVYDQEIDGVVKKRRWIKRMTGFGNLEDFSDEHQPQEWKEKIHKLEDRRRDSSDIYVTDTTPHYHINGFNIGFQRVSNYSAKKVNNEIWPSLPEFVPTEKGKPNPTKPRNQNPHGWLSLYELPAILFYQLLHQKGIAQTSPETIINQHLKNIRTFFDDIENGTFPICNSDDALCAELAKRNLDKSYIPRAIVHYLTSKQQTTFEVKAKERINTLIDETSNLIARIKRHEVGFSKKPGSKDYIEMKCGNMADFLARDIIKLQKPVGVHDGKPNGTEFQQLQAKLAYFGINRDTLVQTFKLCNLIESNNPHPFLANIRIDDCSGILDFYKTYLNLRLKYLTSCKMEGKWNDYHFLKLGEKQRETGKPYIVKLAGKLKDEAVSNIPRGLFLKPITQALKSNPQTASLILGHEGDRMNVSYLIHQYFTRILNDSPQELYTYKKSYELLNKIFDDKKNKRDTIAKKYFTTEELTKKMQKINRGSDQNEITLAIDNRVKKHINDNKIYDDKGKERVKENYKNRFKDFTDSEKQIRLSKTCDMVLFMLIDEIFRKEYVVDNGVLNRRQKVTTQSPVEIGSGFKLSEIKPDTDSGILSLQTTVSLNIQSKTIVKESIKIKNYGDFRGFLKDRRIASLLPYIPDTQVQFEAIQRELEWFERVRIEAFQMIHQFEKRAIKAKNIKADNGFIKHNQILLSLISETDKRFAAINNLRNAFCHSQYPDIATLPKPIDANGFNNQKNYTAADSQILEQSIANQLKNQLIEQYHELIREYNL